MGLFILIQKCIINLKIYHLGVKNMNDKSIRDILISYIKASNNEVRIYQEKNIGGSICDVMAVTNRLTGFEIKSDLDNYQRLDCQVDAYSKFFDENYIVVSLKHRKSIIEKVPINWGIICIENNNITVERKPEKNSKVSRKKQLSILWQLELKNILLKNDLPVFAQKSKNYIIERLVKSVDNKVLGNQIANELLKRDYSIFNVQDYTIHSYSNVPEFEIVDSLSEEDLTRYTLAQWIDLYKKAQELKIEKQVQYNKRTHIERTPHEIKYTDIEARPGVPWISKELINEFACYLADLNRSSLVEYEEITGNWQITSKKYYGNTPRCTAEFGTERYNALYIFEAMLNLRDIKIYDNKIYNEFETIAALEKQKLLLNEFQRWLWNDEDRIWEVEESYNKMFAGFSNQKYDGSRLKFPNMSEKYSLYDYQKDAVQRIISNSNTLLAFDVGAGKTYIMIAAAMKMRQMGLSRKNLFVVPNNIVGQWEKIFENLYPNSKLLAIEPKTYKPQLRQKVLKQIRDGDYDGIIMAYSCFEMIPVSDTEIYKQLESDINEINETLAEFKYHSVWKQNKLVNKKEQLKKLALQLIKDTNMKQKGITFDDLDINTIFLDEAHNYKNIPINTHLRNLVGINTKGSTKCLDMQIKIACVQQSEGGRGAVLATGTPLCNSISDVYAMQMYLQPEKLKERHLDVFDNWVKTFASPEQICEIDVDTSKFRMVRRFAKFFNLPELSKMFSDVSIFHAVSNDNLPNLEGYTDIIIKRNDSLSKYMLELSERTELIRSGLINKSVDNMLKVSTDGRKAALDLSLVNTNEVQSYDKTSKIFMCVQNVIDVYKEHNGCTQLIFCDYSTPKPDEFNVYSKLKELFILNGINEKEIAFIHSYNTEARKLKLFKDFNEGKIRILIGSTFKLGIGSNVQTKLKAIHHLDVPWRPADMVQREGRILRNGNTNENVFIYRYIAEGSFDSYSWQILETKQRFISQFLSGSTYQRENSDLEENVLTYAQVKAIALAQPLMKKRTDKENQLRNLMILNLKNREAEEQLNQELKELKEKLRVQKKRLNGTKRNYDYVKETNFDLKEYSNDFVLPFKSKKICGFEFCEPEIQNDKKPFLITSRLGINYMIFIGDKPNGNIIRVKNFFKHFDKQLLNDEKILSDIEKRIAEILNHQKNKDCNDYAETIKNLKQEIEAIDEEIGLTEDEAYVEMSDITDEIYPISKKIKQVYQNKAV